MKENEKELRKIKANKKNREEVSKGRRDRETIQGIQVEQNDNEQKYERK